jgi:hypothetical protein
VHTKGVAKPVAHGTGAAATAAAAAASARAGVGVDGPSAVSLAAAAVGRAQVLPYELRASPAALGCRRRTCTGAATDGYSRLLTARGFI